MLERMMQIRVWAYIPSLKSGEVPFKKVNSFVEV
jgi:hypothetical protein